jgi:[ribosomal protein S5]-alanine N-acetyltransferase
MDSMSSLDLPVLKTARLLLRPLILDDASDLFAFASDPEVARLTGWTAHRSIEDSHAFVMAIVDRYRQRDVAPWGVVHRGDRRLIGYCGLTEWDREDARAELVYALARPYWGRGYAGEAARAAIAFGFERLGLNRIEATCEPEYVASSRVMEKVGMTFEGVLREHVMGKEGYADQRIYSILRREFVPMPAPW